MWFLYALLSAIFYASLWLFARASRGTHSGVVTASASLWAPIMLFIVSREVDFPWTQRWWQLYLILPFIILPITLRILTIASQRADVTIIKPLAALSTLSTLLVSIVFFNKTIAPLHLLAIVIITIGLLVLYHGRWTSWRYSAPWLALVGVLILGVNVAVVKEVLIRFPHPMAIIALDQTAICTLNAMSSGKAWFTTQWTKRLVLLLLIFAAAMFIQDVFTLLALVIGPAPHVIAIKRTSILLASLGGYFLFHEKNQSLLRLTISSIIVIIGASLLVR